jgi:hypothetical protein
MAGDEDLVKVRVDLPNQPGNSGESMWARPLGGDLYELHNSPFYAYDFNYLDVVYAVSGNPDHKRLIIRVERRSGHRALRGSSIRKSRVRSVCCSLKDG